jgi:hypothetical protein
MVAVISGEDTFEDGGCPMGGKPECMVRRLVASEK